MTEITDRIDAQTRSRGAIFYDGNCRFCTGAAARFGSIVQRRRFDLLPLQHPHARRQLNISDGHLLDEMRLLTSDGRVLGGVDAMLHVLRHIWWAVPIYQLALIPGVRPLLRVLYRRLVPYRYCIAGRCDRPRQLVRPEHVAIAWLPLLGLPVIVIAFGRELPAWGFMWLVAAAIFYGCKWLSWRFAPGKLRKNRLRSIAYLLLWPGMDAEKFLDPRRSVDSPPLRQWLVAIAKVMLGAFLLFAIARHLDGLAAGWVGMIGLILLLHFGLFDLLGLLWRQAGIDASPIMDRPLASTSVAEFWSRRWNRAFNALSRRFVFKPVHRRAGILAALLLTFAISGLLHELVITVPARGGWGGPLAYFLIQAVAILVERAAVVRRIGLIRGIRGWLFVALVTLAPLPLLFPPVFIERVILPFLCAIGALGEPSLPQMNLPLLILIGGALHFAILPAGALLPRVLHWRSELMKLSPLSRHIIWTHGTFIMLVILAFGAISLLNATEIAGGTMLARSFCGFVATFWMIRLVLQFALFDARPYLTTPLLKLGYHGLTAVFVIIVLIFVLAAIAPRAQVQF